jgi:hypothetical protein
VFPANDITNVTDVTIAGVPRTLAGYNPEQDRNGYNESWRYWHQEGRFIRLFVRYEASGDFQVIWNHNRSGDKNVGASYLQNYTTLFTGKWLDRAVVQGESFRCGTRVTNVDGNPVTSANKYTNVGTGADLACHNSFVTVEHDSNWGGHGVNIDEASLAPGNGSPAYVDTLHLDPTVAIQGSFTLEMYVLGDTYHGSNVQEVDFNVNYTLPGAVLYDDSETSQLVLMSATDGFVNDLDDALKYYSTVIWKPRDFYTGTEDQVLTVAPNSQVTFHMLFNSDIGTSMDITFGPGWQQNGSTITVDRGDFYTATVLNIGGGQTLDVTATSVLLGITFTKTIKLTS